MAHLEDVLTRIDAGLDASLDRLKELLRIPSISTDPEYRDPTRRAAEWCSAELAGVGFDASVRPTTGHPIVVAHHPGPGTGPHLLYYGHYDVQPPDPMDLWTSDPFDPQIVPSPHGQRIVLLERLRFLAICSSNMDEFFEVRVFGLGIFFALEQTARAEDLGSQARLFMEDA